MFRRKPGVNCAQNERDPSKNQEPYEMLIFTFET